MTTVDVVIDKGDALPCADSDRITIGGTNAVVSVPGDVSGNEYAYLENRSGHMWLMAASPAVRIDINGKPVTQAVPIRDGDRVVVGSTAFVFALKDQVLTISVGSGGNAGTVPSPQPPRPRAHRPGRLRLFRAVLFSVFVVLMLAVLFVFLATPVSITVDPPPENLEVRGFPPPFPLQGRLLLLPGDYAVRATKPGYVPLMEQVSVERGEFVRFDYALKKLPGRITLHSQPHPAEVRVDGQFVGTTPLMQQKMEAGVRMVRLSAPRYQDAEIRLVVEGLDSEQVVRVELPPDWAPVTVRSNPPGASVQVGDEIVGLTPLTAELLSGDHTLRFELDRYQSESMDISVVAGEALALPMVVLTPTPGTLSIDSEPAGATVTIDGTYRGSTPLEVLLTPAEDHQVVLSKAGHIGAERSVRLEAAQEQTLSVKLAAEFGVIFITSDPADTELFVDGRAIGRASRRLRLTTREHVLEFRRAGYQHQRISLTPRAGVSKQLSVTLLREDAVGTAAAGTVLTAEGQKLQLVEPAQFTMGASRREQGRRANENLRRVELTRPYYIGVREVTNGEFRRFRPDHSSGSAYGRSLDLDDQPVVNVSWDDAVAYMNWLSKKDGLTPVYEQSGESWTARRPLATGYRLPTEAEWANAARFAGEVPRKYAWKGTYPPQTLVENFGDLSASGILPSTLSSYDDKFAVAAPVESFEPNELGLHDIGGNVAEWTNDYYSVYPAGENTVTSDPLGPTAGRHHVIRGAGWKDSTISELRLSYRDYSDSPREDVGFRIARYAE